MPFKIVYGQNDFEKAVSDGSKSITLCAGIYVIPRLNGVVFNRLGPVKVSVECTKREADELGMVFCDIYPEYRSDPASSAEEHLPIFGSQPSLIFHGSYAQGSSPVCSCCGGFGVLGYGIDLI